MPSRAPTRDEAAGAWSGSTDCGGTPAPGCGGSPRPSRDGRTAYPSCCQAPPSRIRARPSPTS
eukprot:313032-Pyramimonas_sp.AAC.1